MLRIISVQLKNITLMLVQVGLQRHKNKLKREENIKDMQKIVQRNSCI